MDNPEFFRIKNRAWEKFCTLPGVHAVGIGKKVTGGVRTDETVLTVFVTRKLPLDALDAQSLVAPVFEGVKTDIIESPIPRTLQGSITVSPHAIISGQTFTFTATDDPPPIGIRIVVTITFHGAGADKVFIVNADSDSDKRLELMIDFLAAKLTGPFFVAAHTATSLTISVPNPAIESLDASCYVLSMDTRAYADEFLRGGIRIQGGSNDIGGTLGCLARLAPTKEHPEYPNGRIVGITCSHLVRQITTRRTGLTAEAFDPTAVELEVVTDAAKIPYRILEHTVVSVGFVRNGLEVSAFYTAQEDEPLPQIAGGLVAAIKAAGLPGLSATLATVSTLKAVIAISGFGGPGAKIECNVHGPIAFPGPLHLRAKVEPHPGGDHTVTFSGAVDGAHIGVFVDIDPGGFAATFGVYHNPLPGQGVEGVAQSISTAINHFPSALRGLVSAGAIGAKVTIAAAKDVRLWLEADIRVGQPIPFFGTASPGICNYRIGRALAVRVDLDVALVQLDAGLKYKFHVQELNAVAGTQVPRLGMPVQKRGAATGLTEGLVTAVGTSGFITSATVGRIYRNGVVIDSTISETANTRRAFAGTGDSGSVVVTKGPGPPKVVGVLFAGSAATGVMTPVDDIVRGFSSVGGGFEHGDLSFDPGIDPDAVHTVPQPASQFRTADADDIRLANGTSLVRPFAALGERMREAEHEIANTPSGREYADLVRRNIDEAFALVNRNRRVATAWHRSGGPELLNALLRVMRFDDEPLPHHINGRPLSECLARLEKAFRRCASPQLSSDMARLAAYLGSLSGLTYPQVLDTLREGRKV